MIVDEIYLNLSLNTGEKSNTLTTALTHSDIEDTVIVVNSFSKYFGMTGWRLGWCIVPQVMTPIIEKLAQNLFICPSTLSQKAALACFSEDALNQCETNRNTLTERAQWVISTLEKMGLHLDAQPEGAFYAYINIKKTGLSAVEFCDALLERHHVALTPGNDFGEHNADHYVRLSFATNETQLKEGLARLAKFVKTLRTTDL